jgi:diguanylate cyclase (GGDEF)-like protein
MFREEDVACRFGGEEFALVLADTTLDQAIQRAEELRIGAHQLVITDGTQNVGSITLSLGVATLPRHGATAATLLRAADKALYVAKNGGRDQVSVAEPIAVRPERPSLRRIV